VNARDAIFGIGKVTIETNNVVFNQAYCETHAEVTPGQYVMLAVSDDGCGMDKETLESLFEPFFTTKEVGEGTGLGLAMIYGIVKQNDGFINVYSEPGLGTTFKLYLPRSIETDEGIGESATRTIQKGNETILLVEDEESILRLGRAILEKFGYNVLAACKPGQAISMAEKYEGPIHLLVTDVVMPEMNGKELKNRIAKLRPDIKDLFMSGYTGNVIVHHGILEDDVHFLQKPFSVDSLAGKVREVLDEKDQYDKQSSF
jgi:CheY-like chemotaxis protein